MLSVEFDDVIGIRLVLVSGDVCVYVCLWVRWRSRSCIIITTYWMWYLGVIT